MSAQAELFAPASFATPPPSQPGDGLALTEAMVLLRACSDARDWAEEGARQGWTLAEAWVRCPSMHWLSYAAMALHLDDSEAFRAAERAWAQAERAGLLLSSCMLAAATAWREHVSWPAVLEAYVAFRAKEVATAAPVE